MRGYLEANGIGARVRGEHLSGGWGELPVDLCSVWVEDEAQYERAHALLVDFLQGEPARRHGGERWRCAGCGETLEGQFTACWRCGMEREAGRGPCD